MLVPKSLSRGKFIMLQKVKTNNQPNKQKHMNVAGIYPFVFLGFNNSSILHMSPGHISAVWGLSLMQRSNFYEFLPCKEWEICYLDHHILGVDMEP